ncbi:MAG: hypothetical protein ACE5JK_04740 [Candidatus Omnitrophota bacterium]
MVALVRLIGILMMLLGVICLIKPDTLLKMIAHIRKGKRVYWSIGTKTVLGIIFLLAALQCRVPLVIALLGILFVSSLVVSLVIGVKGIKVMIEFWENQQPIVLRMWSALTLVIGLLIVVSA